MKKYTNLHKRNYDGTCKICGGLCENVESKKQWEALANEIYELKGFGCRATDKQKRRLRYILKVEQEHLTYHCNY